MACSHTSGRPVASTATSTPAPSVLAAQLSGQVGSRRRVEALGDAQALHAVQPPPRLAHEKHPRAPLRGHEGEQTAQRSVADHGHGHALLHASPLYAEERARQRLGEGGARARAATRRGDTTLVATSRAGSAMYSP